MSLVLALFAITACGTTADIRDPYATPCLSQGSAHSLRPEALDSEIGTGKDHLFVIAREYPTFAGVRLGPANEFIVGLTDGSEETARAVKELYVRDSGPGDEYTDVVAEKAKYSYLQLTGWYRSAANAVMSTMDVNGFGFNVHPYGFFFGVSDCPLKRSRVDAALRRLGVPPDAVVIEQMGPVVRFHALSPPSRDSLVN